MTIYGTPGGTPLNTSGFQGSAPGNPVGAGLPGIAQAGFVQGANGDSRGNQTILAQVSNGNIPVNLLASNAGVVAAGGRPIIEAMARAGEVGYNGSAGGFDSLNSDANGGSGPGSGQSNQTEGPSSGQSSLIEGPVAANLITQVAGRFAG